MGSHYVPQEYLRGFADPEEPGMIWMYDRRTRAVKRLPIITVAQERRYYDAETESRLTHKVEGVGHAALNKLRKERQPPSAEERVWLAVYIATMLTRGPRRRRMVRKLFPSVLESTLTTLNRTIDEWARSPTTDPALVARRRAEVERIREGYRTKPLAQVEGLIHSPWPSEQMIGAVLQMTWRVLTTEGPQFFLTSDNPAHFFAAYGLRGQEAEVWFPVCPELGVHGCWQGPASATLFLPARQGAVKELNRRQVADSVRFVFCHKRQRWIDTVASKPQPYLSRIVWSDRHAAGVRITQRR